MRKKNAFLWIGLLAAALAFTGCSAQNAQETPAPEQETEAAPDKSMEEGTAGSSMGAVEGDTYGVYRPLANDSFEYSLTDSAQEDQIFRIKNVTDQDYSYVSVEILYYDAAGQIMDYYAGPSFFNLLSGMEQVSRVTPSLKTGEYDHIELLYTGGVRDDADLLDPADIEIAEQARTESGKIIAKCVNRTGEDLNEVDFQIAYYSGGELIATQTLSEWDLAADQTFVVSGDAPYDGWYENQLPYDSYTLQVVSVAPLAQG